MMMSQRECGREEVWELVRESKSGVDIGEWHLTFWGCYDQWVIWIWRRLVNWTMDQRWEQMWWEWRCMIWEQGGDGVIEKLISQRVRRDGMMSARTKDFIFLGRGSCRIAASKCWPPTAFRMEMRERSRSRSGCRRSALAYLSVFLMLSQSFGSIPYPSHLIFWLSGWKRIARILRLRSISKTLLSYRIWHG